MKIMLRLKGGPRTTLPADINIFSLPFLYAPNKLFENWENSMANAYTSYTAACSTCFLYLYLYHV